MSILLDCPLCDRQWKVRDEQVNRRTYCPGCDEEYYVPEKLGTRGGRSRRDDEEDEPASRGLSRGAILGLVGGVGGLLLVTSIIIAVVLARNSSKTTTPVAQGTATTTPQVGPAPAQRRPILSIAVYRDVFFFANRSQVEKRLGPGTPITGAEMRQHLDISFTGDLMPGEADKVFNSPVFAFYKWQGDRRAIYAAFNSKDPSGVYVCAVYEGPDVPFKKTHDFNPNLTIMNHLP